MTGFRQTIGEGLGYPDRFGYPDKSTNHLAPRGYAAPAGLIGGGTDSQNLTIRSCLIIPADLSGHTPLSDHPCHFPIIRPSSDHLRSQRAMYRSARYVPMVNSIGTPLLA